jgi:hypothetical protein
MIGTGLPLDPGGAPAPHAPESPSVA